MTDLFEEKARDWDVNETVRALSEAVGRCMLDNVDLHEGMQVMDFGAGTGLITAQVAAGAGKVTAVDVSQAMLEKLAAKPGLQGKVEIRCRNILEQPLAERFDLIVSAMALHHVEDTDRLIRCFAEHLEPGGRVALADLDKEDGSFHPEGTEGVFHSGFDRDELRARLEGQGFIDVRFVTAHTVEKENGDYPVFLVTASKAR